MELWFSEFHAPDVKHSIRVNRHLYSHKSPYQQIDIYETPEFGKVLSLDGNVMLTERDEFIYDEMITHVPMAVHPGIKNVLVIGAGDGGVVHELARYRTIENIDLVEMDEQVVEACRMYLPENASRLDDERVHIYFDNALRFIRRRTDEYDLIIVDSTDPFGPSKGILQKSSMESATMHYMRTESWSISREARFISTMQKRCSAATSGSSVHFQSAECIRHTSRPMRQDTGSLVSQAKNIIRWMILMRRNGRR